MSVWFWAGPSVCVCVCVCRTLNAGSCRSARESECVVSGRFVCVCVSYEECRVAVNLLESECVVFGRSVFVCVCHTRNAD